MPKQSIKILYFNYIFTNILLIYLSALSLKFHPKG